MVDVRIEVTATMSDDHALYALCLDRAVTLYDTNCRDIPEMMRGSADMIEQETEQGIETEAMLGIRLTDSGGVEIYGWGDCDNLKAIALLQLAMVSITSSTLGYG